MAFRGELDRWRASLDIDIPALSQIDDSSDSLEKLEMRLQQIDVERQAITEKIRSMQSGISEGATELIETHKVAA